MNKVKIAIVGCGSTMMYMYGHVFKYLDNAVLAAVMDVDEARAKLAQSRYGAAVVYADYDRMLADDEIEAVIIATPVFLHHEHVLKAAAAGKHVLCEKPLARTIDECDQMIAACSQNNVLLMTGFMKRFNENFRIAKQLVDAGRLGEIIQVRAQWDLPAPEMDELHWRYALPAWGGIYLDHGAHVIDLCCWWAGDVETVSAEIGVLRPKSETDDQAVVTLRHINGAVSHHHMTCMWHKDTLEVYEIYGTKATLELKLYGAISCMTTEPFAIRLYENGGRTITDLSPYYQGTGDDDSDPTFGPTCLDVYDKTRDTSQYLKELSYFCDCVQNQQMPDITGIEGRRAIEIVNAAFLSSWQGKKIKLPLSESPDLERIFTEIKRR